METSTRATRTTVMAAIFLAALMLGVPSALTGGKQMSATDNAAAANGPGDRLFIVGGLDFTNAVSTLSPYKYTSAQEMMTIWPCMSTVLTYDMDGIVIGDIARSWTISPDGLTWSFIMEPNIYFTDPAAPSSKAHQLTWQDIAYTFYQTQNYTNNLQSYFLSGSGKIIDRIWGSAAANTVNITLNVPYAPFMSALTALPIIPKYYWQPHEDAKGDATGWTGAMPIGSGPWYYGLPGLPSTGEVVLVKSPIWFQETNRGWQLHVNTLKYRSETDAATAWNDLKLGNIDVFMGVSPSTFLNDLPNQPALVGWAQSTGFVYEFNLNQMTDAMRTALGPPYNSGSANQILQDPIVRKAMLMGIDKNDFVTDTLSGLGNPADSLVPDVNPWYYSPQNQVNFDTAGANALLTANGYIDINTDGIRECTATSPAYLKGLAALNDPLTFKFATLSSSTEWQIGATNIKEHLSLIGVNMVLTINTYNQMSQFWMKADYDTWLWDWMFSPTSDVSTDIMQVLTTDAFGTWQDIYWSNATYDELYNRSLLAMDPTARRDLTNQLQQIAYDSYSCNLIAYRKELYSAWKGEWGGYGNWATNYQLMPDQLYPYLYMQISPNGTSADTPNTAPQISSLNQNPPAVNKGVNSPFTGSATDTLGTTLNYQWFWGDGSSSGWLASGDAYHPYAKDGYYTAYFAVKEVGTADGFITVKPVHVTVNDNTNTAPHNVAIAKSPDSPNTGTTITFTGSAIDDQSDPLTYIWTFGDTYGGAGAVVTHRYAAAGSYSVTLSVTDNHVSTQPRPVSTSVLVSVTANHAPTITVPAYGYVGWKVNSLFTVTASDSDGDALRYTWNWGDGLQSVTTTPTATHSYAQKGIFTLTVYADDLTGIAGHNASGSNSVNVQTPTPHAPTYVSLTPTPNPAEVGQSITFTAIGSDQDGGVLKFTMNYGGGAYSVWSSASTLPNEQVTHAFTHSFATTGTKTVYVSIADAGLLNTTSPGVTVNIVLPNQPPMVTPLDPVSSTVGTTLSFVGDAFDPDNAVLRYTWSFGDGSAMKVGQSVSYAFTKPGAFTVTIYVDDLTGLTGHNVTESATYTIGFRLDLAVGWNLVSLPMVKTVAYKASTLGLGSGDQVVQWNSETMLYKTYIVGMPLNDFTIDPSAGYWIYAASAKALTLYGEVPTLQQMKSVVVPASGGWALVGMCSMNTGWRAANLATMYSGASMTNVVRWTAATQSYTTYIVGMPLNNFLLVPGQGYWVYVDGSGMLTYSP